MFEKLHGCLALGITLSIIGGVLCYLDSFNQGVWYFVGSLSLILGVFLALLFLLMVVLKHLFFGLAFFVSLVNKDIAKWLYKSSTAKLDKLLSHK